MKATVRLDMRTPLAIDRSSPMPLYGQIHDQLQRLIVEGRLDQVELSDGWLATHFGVSRMTVRQALDALVNEGLIKRQRGKGTLVVSPPIHGQLESIERFFDEWRIQGADVQVSVIARWIREADSQAASILGLEVGEPIGYFRRLRYVDGVPVCIDDRYIAASLLERLSDTDLATQPTWILLREKLNVAVVRADMRILATSATAEEAQLLQIAEGAPLLERGLECYGVDGLRMLAGPSRFRSDRFVYQVSVKP
ncbi:MAG: GntR family transcriptional regulator [bacterium]|nr:GntR family transcriptional regulator [bacterium]